MNNKTKTDGFYDDCLAVQLMIQRYSDPAVLRVVVAPLVYELWKRYKTKVPYQLLTKELQTLHANILNRNYAKNKIQRHPVIGRKPGQVNNYQQNN